MRRIVSDRHREIERKFLVHAERLPAAAIAQGERLIQGYLSSSPAVRIRVAEPTLNADGTETEPARAWLTIKGPGLVERAEFEYAISPADARAMLPLAKTSIAKIRYRIPAVRHTWEVDQFEGPHAGLWLAEIELGSADEAFDRPEWLGAEVSEDPRYANVALAQAGKAPAT